MVRESGGSKSIRASLADSSGAAASSLAAAWMKTGAGVQRAT